MSFDKHMGKEHRKPYRGGKAIDKTCRNHGGCPWCEGNRKYSDIKRRQSADEKLEEEIAEERNWRANDAKVKSGQNRE